METQNLITYKWNNGVYNLQDMLILVQFGNLSPEQFFKITRYDYETIKNKKMGATN